MAPIRRTQPYIWVTWLTELMAGSKSCEWSSWFKAQHEGKSWDEVPSSLNTSEWLMAHAEKVRIELHNWTGNGYTTFVEGQNLFSLRGRVAVLGGKPDIIATKGSEGTIIEVKTGKRRESHDIQTMIYMYAIPMAMPRYRNITFNGLVVYDDHKVPISPSTINNIFVRRLAALIKRLANNDPAIRVSSADECRFCNISSANCPERKASDENSEGITDDF